MRNLVDHLNDVSYLLGYLGKDLWPYLFESGKKHIERELQNVPLLQELGHK
jgi:hypothetical protein